MRLLPLALLVALLLPGTAAAATAPGAPGEAAHWAPADKDGFGTAHNTTSKVWHTLQGGELTDVYYPRLDTPAFRDLQFAVSDGRTFAERETDAASHTITLTDKRSLTYRQVTSTPRYRIVKTYVTDPARNALLIDVRFTSRTGKKLALYALADPALSNTGNDDSGTATRHALFAHDASAGEALIAKPRFKRTLGRLPRHERRLERPAHGLPDGPRVHERAGRQRRADRPHQARRRAQAAPDARARLRRQPGRARAPPPAPRSTVASAAPRAATRTAGIATSAR